MSRFFKARELLDFVLELAGRRAGMTLAEIAERSPAPLRRSRQTAARRLVAEVETLLPGAVMRVARDDGTAVALDAVAVAHLPAATAAELFALAQAAAFLRERGEASAAQSLERLALALRARLRLGRQRSREADVEALLEGRHLLARPGPRATMAAEVIGPLSDALLALRRVAFTYTRPGGPVRYEVEPWGLITAGRTYLVARPAGRTSGDPARWRLDRIADVAVLEAGYAIPEAFDLAAYARRSFGSFYHPAEYGEVVWRFRPAAAAAAVGFQFHPDQVAEWEDDGSLVVRFHAAGLLEMAWFLYPWGDTMEVLAPVALQEMVRDYRRSDFPALP